MPRLLRRQSPRAYEPEPEGLATMDGLIIAGRDPGAAHRQRVREANRARQEADRQHEPPALLSEAWLADQLRKSQLSGMRVTNQMLVNEAMAHKAQREVGT